MEQPSYWTWILVGLLSVLLLASVWIYGGHVACERGGGVYSFGSHRCVDISAMGVCTPNERPGVIMPEVIDFNITSGMVK